MYAINFIELFMLKAKRYIEFYQVFFHQYFLNYDSCPIALFLFFLIKSINIHLSIFDDNMSITYDQVCF